MVIPAEGADDVGVAMVDGALVTKKVHVGQAQSPQPPLAHTLYTERKKGTAQKLAAGTGSLQLSVAKSCCTTVCGRKDLVGV